MKVIVGKQGLGTVWTFEPTTKKAEAKMRTLFASATWHGDVMYVEHRYEISTGEVLLKRGFRLIAGHQAVTKGVELTVADGCFVLKEKAA